MIFFRYLQLKDCFIAEIQAVEMSKPLNAMVATIVKT